MTKTTLPPIPRSPTSTADNDRVQTRPLRPLSDDDPMLHGQAHPLATGFAVVLVVLGCAAGVFLFGYILFRLAFAILGVTG